MSAPLIITRRTLAASAAQRWKNQYAGWSEQMDRAGHKAAVLLQLQALGPNPEPDAVDAVIGNRSWTTVPNCDGCGAAGCPAVVSVGESADIESSTARLCEQCVSAAVSALTAHGAHR